MTHITKEEVRKIARISSIALAEDEVEGMTKRLADVLTYAERVKEVAAEVEEVWQRQENIMRSDTIIPTNPAPLLAQAPEQEENYYVVPKVLGGSS